LIPPSKCDWQWWHEALTKSLHLSQNQQLANPIGCWHLPNTPTGWLFEPQLDCLWSAFDHIWLLHGYVPARTQTKHFLVNVFFWVWSQVPLIEALHKVMVMHVGYKVKLTRYGLMEQTQAISSNPSDQFAKLQFARDWELEIYPDGTWMTMLQDLHDGKGFAVSDGSFHQGTGAAAWIVEEGMLAMNQVTTQVLLT